MQLITFELDSQPRPGLLRGHEVIDLGTHFGSVAEFVKAGESALEVGRTILETARPMWRLNDVRLRAPLDQPQRCLLATGWNYFGHFQEGIAKRRDRRQEAPKYPTFFTKSPTTVIGPRDPIPYDLELSSQLDYEAELVVVIGVGGKNIPVDRALVHVFGYMLGNDVTARDIQRRHGGQWIKGKSLDNTCPLGPALVTADEIPDPQSVEFRCEVNGELRQRAFTGDMAFTVGELIHHLSAGMTLHSGDIIMTGTPAGVGYAKDTPTFLHPGDVVAVKSLRLGELCNTVTAVNLTEYSRLGTSVTNQATTPTAADA